MMKSGCLAGGCRNVESPLNLKWPEGEKMFLKKLIIENEKLAKPSSPLSDRSQGPTKSRSLPSDFEPSEYSEGYSYAYSRRRFLGIYRFTTKKEEENVVKRTKRWFRERRQRKSRKSQLDKSVNGGSAGCFPLSWLKVLLVCVAEVDVHDHVQSSGCRTTAPTKVCPNEFLAS
ncbi:hypothetical protein SLE2022_302910 [Rubroshorea leprosula]